MGNSAELNTEGALQTIPTRKEIRRNQERLVRMYAELLNVQEKRGTCEKWKEKKICN